MRTSVATENSFIKGYWAKSGSYSEMSPDGEFHLLAYHQLDVAACFASLAATSSYAANLFGGSVPALTAMVACHDIGKYASGFQVKQPLIISRIGSGGEGRNLPGSSLRHTAAGYVFWRDIVCNGDGLGDRFMSLMPTVSSLGYSEGGGWHSIFQAVFYHHGVPGSEHDGYGVSEVFTDTEIEDACLFVEAVHRLMLPDGYIMPRLRGAQVKKMSLPLAGLIVLSDWMGSARGHFAWPKNGSLGIEDYWVSCALPQAKKILQETGVLPATPVGPLSLHQLFPYLRDKAPTPLQRAALTIGLSGQQNIVMVEDTPGAGKTEAALALANRMMSSGAGTGVLFTLPTTATATSMFTRLDDVWHRLFSEGVKASSILSHSRSRHFMRKIASNGHAVSEWLMSGGRQALMANFGVGTIDQSLMGVLASKFNALRLAGLIGKVLIIDEVHSYDAYTTELTKLLLLYHAMTGGSAICLSATMSLKLRQELMGAFARGAGCTMPRLTSPAFPAISYWSPDSGLQQTAVEPATTRRVRVRLIHSEAELQERILGAAMAGDCVCWVRNTVEDAKAAYASISARRPPGTVRLIHSRFTMSDRVEKEQQIIDIYGPPGSPGEHLRAGTIVISTQVIEQSLNCDFDVMASDLAPIDVLLQRQGRQHRHDRGDRGVPEMLILSPDPDVTPDHGWYSGFLRASSFIYPMHAQVYETARIISGQPDWVLPYDIRNMMEQVYDNDYADSLYDGFRPSGGKVAGERMGQVARSRDVSINPLSGYTVDNIPVKGNPSTRPCDQPTVTLRLRSDSRSDFGGEYPDSGDVMVPLTKVDAPFEEDDDTGGLFVVHVKQRADGTWAGIARKDGRPVIVTYSQEFGVSVER